MNKLNLIARLRQLGAFWSYAPEADISDEILTEEALRWGDVAEIQALFELFPLAYIKKVWREKLLPDTRIYAHNYYLALIFFNIKNPKKYILPLQKKYSRYERISQFTA